MPDAVAPSPTNTTVNPSTKRPMPRRTGRSVSDEVLPAATTAVAPPGLGAPIAAAAAAPAPADDASADNVSADNVSADNVSADSADSSAAERPETMET